MKPAVGESGQLVSFDKWFEVNTQPVMLAIKRLQRQEPGFVQDKGHIRSIEQRKDSRWKPVRRESLDVNRRMREPAVRGQRKRDAFGRRFEEQRLNAGRIPKQWNEDGVFGCGNRGLNHFGEFGSNFGLEIIG